MNKLIIFWLAVLLMLAGFFTFRLARQRGEKAEPGFAAEVDRNYSRYDGKEEVLVWDFELTERSGRLFKSKELEGSIWVSSFFFASCPSSCRQQNLGVKQLHSTWAEKGVTFVCISCDPERDSPSRLREYALDFTDDYEHWLFLTGHLDYISRIGAERFQLLVRKQTHSDRLVVVDKWGNLRGSFNWHEAEEVVAMETLMAELLVEESEPAEEAEKRQQLEEIIRQMEEDGVIES
jgi:cytochrome oxidase Cu insertion factor (SCO1/SenC/PrrC family)